MQARDEGVFIRYINATWKGDPAASFYTKLKAYQNRPFDDIEKVKKKLGDDEFKNLFAAHCKEIQSLDSQYQLPMPVTLESLHSLLPSIEGKLTELVRPLHDQLTVALGNEPEIAEDERKRLILDMARGYAFHLLMSANDSLKSTNIEMYTVYHGFYHILRNSLFTEDVTKQFLINLEKKLASGGMFTQLTIQRYTAMYGDIFFQILCRSLEANLGKIEYKELPIIKKIIDENDEIDVNTKKRIADLLDSEWLERKKAYIQSKISNTDVSLADELFGMAPEIDYHGPDAQKLIFDKLANLSFDGKFESKKSREKFILKVLEHLKSDKVQQSVRDTTVQLLSKKFEEWRFDSKELAGILGKEASKSSIARMFSRVGHRVVSGAHSVISTKGPK